MTKQELRDKLVSNLNYKTWTTSVYARNKKGRGISPISKAAARWCVAGLACKFAKQTDVYRVPGWAELASDFHAKYNNSPINVNDTLKLRKLKQMLVDLYKD